MLGDTMYIPPASDRPPTSFQSPETLKNRIIISDKPPGESIPEQVIACTFFWEEQLLAQNVFCNQSVVLLLNDVSEFQLVLCIGFI
jgi:hypothetical protein